MGRLYLCVCACALLCAPALSRHDDDFAFDNGDEFQVELTLNHSEITRNGLKRLWGVPDTSAYVGHLFRMEIPKEAFSGEVIAYKVRTDSGRHTPSWLAVDSKHGLISGLPQHQDIGPHTLTVTAHGRTHGLTATDSFTIEVKKAEDKPHSKYGVCGSTESRLELILLVDSSFHQIPPRQRIRALMDLSGFMALDGDEFWMEPYKAANAQTVLMSGPGSSPHRRGDSTTAIYFNVGCGEKLWTRHKVLVAGVREQARDGTLEHMLRLPVLGWRLLAVKPAPRPKRQVYDHNSALDGSGGYDNYDADGDPDADADDYSGYGDNDDYDSVEPEVDIKPYPSSEASNVNYTRTLPATPRRIGDHSQVQITPEEPTTTEPETDYISSTEMSSTIIGRTTETVSMPMPVNQAPTLKHHMKKLAITAGKAFRYIIPADLFTDPEEGSNLTFTMYEAENVKLSPTSWIQFIPHEREVYGLPLDAHVSRWNFIVEAHDSEGQVARGPLDITVQQHKSGRTINHQFILQFKLNKLFTNSIDWQIRALEGIVNLFRDTDMEQLTVLNATQNGDICEFVWTNDTLPKDSVCPKEGINRLMKIMESDTEPGSPSANLVKAMSPDLKVSGVSWKGMGNCAPNVPATKSPNTYFPPVPRNQVDHLAATVGHLLVFKVPSDTFFDPEDGGTPNLALSLRYSDRSELPSGHWLQFDAKNQEFYGLPGPGDEGSVSYQLIAEDSSKMSAYDSLMVEVSRAPTIKPTVEFQMTLEYPFPNLAYNANNKRKVVEKLAALFNQTETDNIRIHSITDNPTTIIWYNTSLPMDRCPKKEIEELRKMIIVDERNSMGALKENVDHVFDKDLKVMSIRLIPLGLCAEQNTKTPKMSPPVYTGATNSLNKPGGASVAVYTEYLVTFIIPGVVIVCMVLVASIIACVLYRRRRTGKMSVGDEEERQAFRSKGIPVIFQDELEERGDTEPVHKSPVIMREEKPPLLPPAPEYRSGEDAPYRPPPPFAASRTPPRPKATPTYRKPPPYVPP